MHHLTSLIFWIIFLIPGLAVLMRWDRSLTKAGILPTLALSFVASLSVVTPLSILGFLFNLPVWVLSAFVLLFMAWGIYDLFVSKHQARQEVLDILKGFLVIESLVLLVGCLASARIGSKLGADGLIHMARIRQFLDHGLTNADPFVQGDHFYGIYHTNLFHALFAVCSQLTRVDHMGVWHAFLPLANVFIGGGIAFLAVKIFPKVWIGWLAAIFFLVDQGSVDFMTYPNKMAPFFLIPVLIAFVIQALESKPSKKDFVQVMAVSLLIAQFHGMYSVFICVLVGPTIMGFAIYKLFKRQDNPLPWVFLGIAVLFSLPWPIVSKLDEIQTEREAREMKIARDADPDSIQVTSGAKAAVIRQDPIRKKFYFFENGWLMKDPLRGWGGGKGFFSIPGYRYQLLLFGLIAAYFSTRRRYALIAFCVLLSCAAFLYLAPLCTFLLWVVEAEWIVLRLETAGFPILFPALGVGAIAWHVSKLVTLRWAQSIIIIIAIPFSLSYSGQAIVEVVPFRMKWKDTKITWRDFISVAKKPASERERELNSLRESRVLLETHLPRGEVVLCRDTRAMEVVMLWDVNILAPIRSSSGVPELSYLRKINRMLINERSDWELRSRILRNYGVRFYLPQGNPRWIEGHVKERDGKLQKFIIPNQPGWKMVELDLDD